MIFIGAFLIVILIYYGAQKFLTLEERVDRYIKEEVKRKGWIFKKLRAPTRFDGASPFYEKNIRYGELQTEFFGMHGEQLFTRVIDVEKEGILFRYWVRVETVNFRPYIIEWRDLKIITSENKDETIL